MLFQENDSNKYTMLIDFFKKTLRCIADLIITMMTLTNFMCDKSVSPAYGSWSNSMQGILLFLRFHVKTNMCIFAEMLP